jgi:hypothetical protein
MTVQRTIHLLYPETRPWGFILGDENDSDRKIFQYFMWTLSAPDEAMAPARLAEIGRRSVVVAFQPPWILSEQDIKEFSQCRSVCNHARFLIKSLIYLLVSSVSRAR